MENLTERQSKILSFIGNYIAMHGFAPSIREIAKHFRIVSLNAVRQHLLHLEEKGLLDIASHHSRGISLPGAQGLRIPVVGQIAAGSPILAEQNIDTYFSIDPTFLKTSEEVFSLKVKGDSMEPEILNGDYVLCKRQDHAGVGDTVVAVIENEATVKVLHKKEGRYVLHALNPKYSDILDEFIISGKVVGLIRNF